MTVRRIFVEKRQGYFDIPAQQLCDDLKETFHLDELKTPDGRPGQEGGIDIDVKEDFVHCAPRTYVLISIYHNPVHFTISQKIGKITKKIF